MENSRMAQTKTDATVVPLFGFGRAQIDDETEYRQRAAPLLPRPAPPSRSRPGSI